MISKWDITLFQSNFDNSKFKFISSGESVEGYTDTIKLYESTGSNERYIWFAKDIGIVKIDSFNEFDGGIFGYGDMDLYSIQ